MHIEDRLDGSAAIGQFQQRGAISLIQRATVQQQEPAADAPAEADPETPQTTGADGKQGG